MTKKLIAAAAMLIVISCSFLVVVALAESPPEYTIYLDPPLYSNGEPVQDLESYYDENVTGFVEEYDCINVNVLVAYDEEIYGTFGSFAYIILGGIVADASYILHHTFDINLHVIDFVFVESPDGTDIRTLFYTARQSLEWNSPKQVNGHNTSILIYFTLDWNVIFSGHVAGAIPEWSMVVQGLQRFWLDGRVLVHELSHLHGVPDHFVDDPDHNNCIMSYACYWEHQVGRLVYGPGYVRTTAYCDECFETISANRYRYQSYDDGLPEADPQNTPSNNPWNPWPPFILPLYWPGVWS